MRLRGSKHKFKYFTGDIEATLAALEPHYGGLQIEPTMAQLREMLSHPRFYDQPLAMVNFLKYYETAQYSTTNSTDSADSAESGRAAYDRYSENTMPHVYARGGRLLYAAKPEQVIIGDESSESWDTVAIMEYPSRAAFFDMLLDPNYIAGIRHRDAGLKRTKVFASKTFYEPSNPLKAALMRLMMWWRK